LATDIDIEEAQTRAEARADEPSRGVEVGTAVRKKRKPRAPTPTNYSATYEVGGDDRARAACRAGVVGLLANLLQRR